MNHLIDGWLTPGLWFLTAWSVRWAVLIGVLLACFAARLIRGPAARLLAARLVLFAGLLLPLVPRYWGPVMTPQPAIAVSAPTAPSMSPDESAGPLEKPAGALPVADAIRRELPQVVPTTISPAAIAELSPQESLGTARLAVLIVAAIWIAGMLVQATRLLIAWRWLRCVCRNAVPLGDRDLSELNSCRRQLCLRRQVRLGTHGSVHVPILVGGVRPWILVPPQWQLLSPASQHAILLHELAHAQRRDDFAKLAEELVRTVFFFHPLIHWMLARIAADREEMCDAVVINQGTAPRDLAGVLLECCRTCGVGQTVRTPDGWALPLFRRPGVKERIELLMEDHAMSRWTLRPSRLSIAAILIASVGLFTTVGGFGLRAADPKVEKQEPPAAAAASKSAETKPIAVPTRTKTIELPDFLTPDNARSLQAGLPIEIKGFGKVTSSQLAFMVLAGRDEGLRIRLLDIQGNPLLAHGSPPIAASVMTLGRGAGSALPSATALVDAQGRFLALPPPDGVMAGGMIPFQVRLADGQCFESGYSVTEATTPNEMLDVHLPTHFHPKAAPPRDVGPEDLAGLVVDEQGRPLEGVEVCLDEGGGPDNRRRTGKDGRFRFKNCGKMFIQGQTKVVLIRFRKAAYSTERFLHQPLGVRGWVVALGSRTFFEGTVRGSDGKPAAGVAIRANQGPKQNENGVFPDLWTETVSDSSGRYRLYVQPDAYEFIVRSRHVGVIRLPKQPIVFGEHRSLDIALQPGVTFTAAIVDSRTNKPVPNVRLWHWQYRGIEGRTGADGKLAIADILPGIFQFDVDASGYARWWSDDAASAWNRKDIGDPQRHWQRNFDSLDFELDAGMRPVTIVIEKEMHVQGRVVDPNGKPVGGATVAPALSGTGNSITGDTRFSVETKSDGTFDIALPASHQAKYNLVAHDGKFEQWRRWANGVLPPFSTTPGQVIQNVELKLNRPASIRGRVVDAQGRRLANVQVDAAAADLLDNRYYTPPFVKTDANGRFELRFLRPGDYLVNAVAPETRASLAAKRISVVEGHDVSDVEIRVPQPASEVKPLSQMGPQLPSPPQTLAAAQMREIASPARIAVPVDLPSATANADGVRPPPLYVSPVTAPPGQALPAAADEIDPIPTMVQDAIIRGRSFLIRAQNNDGSLFDNSSNDTRGKVTTFPVGQTSLAVLALLSTGTKRDDPVIFKAVEFLRRSSESKMVFRTYESSLEIAALVAVRDWDRDRDRITALARSLEADQRKIGALEGMWNYGRGPLGGGAEDNSNTQFAILGLREAAKAGVPISRVTWERTVHHFVKFQNTDGGWGYMNGQPSTGSMTSSAIASLILCDRMLSAGAVDIRDDASRKAAEEIASRRDTALKRGRKWLTRYFTVGMNPGQGSEWYLYYLYELSRAARESGQQTFGRHDWYREAAALLVAGQSARDGYWQGASASESGKVLSTSFVLLVLDNGSGDVPRNNLK